MYVLYPHSSANYDLYYRTNVRYIHTRTDTCISNDATVSTYIIRTYLVARYYILFELEAHFIRGKKIASLKYQGALLGNSIIMQTGVFDRLSWYRNKKFSKFWQTFLFDS